MVRKMKEAEAQNLSGSLTMSPGKKNVEMDKGSNVPKFSKEVMSKVQSLAAQPDEVVKTGVTPTFIG